ncbi:uncharacterized protein LOC111066546 [Drosophila obscura]|nr:uncharacterized protein LOC111066546 [Drosophila obscura]
MVKPIKLVRSIYKNHFLWSLIKSCALFSVGVFVAKELKGLELMPTVGPA